MSLLTGKECHRILSAHHNHVLFCWFCPQEVEYSSHRGLLACVVYLPYQGATNTCAINQLGLQSQSITKCRYIKKLHITEFKPNSKALNTSTHSCPVAFQQLLYCKNWFKSKMSDSASSTQTLMTTTVCTYAITASHI